MLTSLFCSNKNLNSKTIRNIKTYLLFSGRNISTRNCLKQKQCSMIYLKRVIIEKYRKEVSVSKLSNLRTILNTTIC